MTFYARADVMATAGSESGKRALVFIELRDLVDALPCNACPSDEELAAKALPPFRVSDMRSLIETRKYRRENIARRPGHGEQ
jgi:hypothetical protein